MSAQALQHARPGRFVRVYLITWGLLAAGGLTYLASLAWQVDFRASQGQQQAAKPTIDPEQGLRVANKALAEIDSVQHTVIEMQKDLGRLKDTVGQRDAQDKEAQTRLAALEERVTTLATPPPVAAVVVTVPPSKQKAADKAKADKRAAEQRTASRVISVVEDPKPEPPAATESPAASPKFETGSIPGRLPPSRSASPR